MWGSCYCPSEHGPGCPTSFQGSHNLSSLEPHLFRLSSHTKVFDGAAFFNVHRPLAWELSSLHMGLCGPTRLALLPLSREDAVRETAARSASPLIPRKQLQELPCALLSCCQWRGDGILPRVAVPTWVQTRLSTFVHRSGHGEGRVKQYGLQL